MKNVYIYCEGQTEETFVNKVLAPYFANSMIFVIPIICTTSRKHGVKNKGGVSNYGKIKSELTLLCKQHKNELFTTMFDYYGMPDDTPNIANGEENLYKRISNIEQAIEQDLGMPNLIFNFMVHEFEALLFSEPDAFSLITTNENVEAIKNARNSVETPEHINNSPITAPSKRLEALMPNYAKIINGSIISQKIGIDKIMAECKHFSNWIEKIRN